MECTHSGPEFRLIASYLPCSLQQIVKRPPEDQHLGLLGPLLRVAPGDTVSILLDNRLDFPINIEPSGLIELPQDGDKEHDGSPVAEPGSTVSYHWEVPAVAGPSEGEPDTKLWLYRSTIYPERSDNAGLFGPILVSRPGADISTGRDIITAMQVIDEGASPLLAQNMQGRTAQDLGINEEQLQESLQKHVVNGYVFCNLPGLNITQGDLVRWHFAAVGSEGDMHTAHLHGHTWLQHGHRADQMLLVPGTVQSVTMEARTPGTWLLHCHVDDHIHAGMMAMYTVAPSASLPSSMVPDDSTVRRHYVAAEVVEWNYAPLGGDACLGAQQAAASQATITGPSSPSTTATTTTTEDMTPVLPWSTKAFDFVANGTGRAGARYLKALYIEYTDDTFTKKKQRSPEDAYLGLLGPIMRAEVDETIEVVFLNRLNYSVSMHPHGVAYGKSFEGAPYNDGSTADERMDDAVPPGANYTYVWTVPETSGPGPLDPSSVVWMYHSHTYEVTDPYAGLVGALIVGRPGAFRRINGGTELGEAADVDKEAVAMFSVIDERQSLMWDDNLLVIQARDAENNKTALASSKVLVQTNVPGTALAADGEPAPSESDMMHAINGYIYCNGAPLRVLHGSLLRLHVIVIGSEADVHTPSLLGASFDVKGTRSSSFAALPGVMTTADVQVDADPGPAFLQCRVADHIASGMQAIVNIEDNPSRIAFASVEAASSSTSSEGSLSSGSGEDGDGDDDSLPGAVTVRPYFITAEEISWNYVPSGQYQCTTSGGPRPFEGEETFYTNVANNTMGTIYTKAVYKRYDGPAFVTQIQSPAHQGLLGPVIAAEVGDILEITFKNTLNFSTNLRLDGGFVALEGSANPDKEVAPGQVVTYRLYVPEGTGPASSDLSTVAYAYTSSVDFVAHPMAGLVGMALIGLPGSFASENASSMSAVPIPRGAKGLLPILAAIMNENFSPYVTQNAVAVGIHDLDAAELIISGHDPLGLTHDTADLTATAASSTTNGNGTTTPPVDDAYLYQSNLMHSLNGYMYCKGPSFELTANQNVRVIVLTVGSEGDLHSIQFAGQALKGGPGSYAHEALEPLMPAITITAEVTPSEAGLWPITCALHEHVASGMQALLKIVDDGSGGGSDGGKLSASSSTAARVGATVLWTVLAASSLVSMLLL